MGSQNPSAPKASPHDDLSIPTEVPSPPPSYVPDGVIPDINAGFQNLDLAKGICGSLPTPDHCIAHLKLLEAFHTLREDVGYNDGLFGISDSLVPNVLTTTSEKATDSTNATLAKIREKRWAIYVSRAADRFQAWLLSCVPMTSNGLPRQRLKEDDLYSKEYEMRPYRGRALSFSKDDLPPLGSLFT